MDRIALIKELNQTLKQVSNCDENEIKEQGEKIREVFYTMIERHFTVEEINDVFKDVSISDEKLALIEENDKGIKR